MKNIFKALVIGGLLIAGITTQASAQYYPYRYDHTHYGYYDHPRYYGYYHHPHYYDHPHYGYYDHPRHYEYRGY
jgi:hypothetical protein